MLVLVAEGEVWVGDVSEKEEKGSAMSLVGDLWGVGRGDGLACTLLRRPAVDTGRAILDEFGEARRERVLRKVDLRLGGGVEFI
jgi:hypothetical protein